jgi:hypothetical protein
VHIFVFTVIDFKTETVPLSIHIILSGTYPIWRIYDPSVNFTFYDFVDKNNLFNLSKT